MDGSFHPWQEERGPGDCPMDLVDDAINTTLVRLGEEERIWVATGASRSWIGRYGVQLALNVAGESLQAMCHAAGAATRVRAAHQFGCMCTKLGIELIAASSPQAKGRVWRMHGTH